ncbi:LLM class flavin-dependent oxidoreductase [[Eubacterium] cellulosolvens]
MLNFGICIPQEGLSYKTIEEIAIASEKLGYSSIWLYDHLFSFPNPDKEPLLECWTTLTALASKTKRIRLGPFVLNNQFRYPSIVAKMAASLDVICNGRLEFGIGAGARKSGRASGHTLLGYKPEYRAYGIHYPEDTPSRVKCLRESIKIIKKMWTEDIPSFRGDFFTIDGAICNPKPIQRPHPPILIGGAGERYTLKVVAELADISNFPWSFSPEECERKIRVLNKYCEQTKRDINDIKKSVSIGVVLAKNKTEADKKVNFLKRHYQSWYEVNYPPYELRQGSLIGSQRECIQKIEAFKKAGVSYFIVSFPEKDKIESLYTFSEKIIPNI